MPCLRAFKRFWWWWLWPTGRLSIQSRKLRWGGIQFCQLRAWDQTFPQPPSTPSNSSLHTGRNPAWSGIRRSSGAKSPTVTPRWRYSRHRSADLVERSTYHPSYSYSSLTLSSEENFQTEPSENRRTHAGKWSRSSWLCRSWWAKICRLSPSVTWLVWRWLRQGRRK